jgi:phenylalanyl-tRNA synthetase beta chain
LTIPSWRNDISIQEDIVEEIARIYGYDNLDSIEIPLMKIDAQKESEEFSDKMWKVRQRLVAKGLDEVISWAFMREDLAGEFVANNPKMKVVNPISSDLEYMRPSLIPNLLSAVAKNNARGYKNLNLFEIGKVYLGSGADDQPNIIAGMRYGKTADKNIYHDERKYDIFDAKKDLMDVLEIFGFDEDSVQISRDAPDYYHPQRSGSVCLGKDVLGCFGEVHPVKAKAFDIKDKVNVFELYLDNLPKRRVKSGTAKSVFDVSDLQMVTRDFAFIFDKDVDANKLRRLAKGVNKELIESVNLFDVYEGENIGVGKKSIAFNIVIQPKIKTMTSEEIDVISDAVVGKIVGELGGVLRDS